VTGGIEEDPERVAGLMLVLHAAERDHRRLGLVESSTSTSRCIC
jgi:hypothetical protein